MTESTRMPDGVQGPRTRARPRGPSPSPLNPLKQHATSDVDVAAADRALRERGITNPERLLESATPDAILGACRWFDEQHGRVGLGVLVNEIKAGGKAGWSPNASHADVVCSSAEYQAGVWDWVAENFPDLCDEDGLASPHAVAAVFRLHCIYGKGRLTVAEHGPLIRGAVEFQSNGGGV